MNKSRFLRLSGLLTLLLGLFAPMALAQTITVKGVVTDAKYNEPVIGATVMLVEDASKGVMTNMDGEFVLTGVPSNGTLRISYVGYKTIELPINGQTNFSVVLQEDIELLDEVVVVGFGTQKKVNVTGAVTAVDSKELTARPVNSVVDALQGIVPGMNFSVPAGGGALSKNKQFNIRGTGTIGAGSSVSPLVLIDGMEGDINAVNPQDIENISVLKDTSSASIYGSRAAGGVVLVTTKSGKSGKTIVNYNNSFRLNTPLNMPKMMDSYTWALYMNDGAVNAGGSPMLSNAKLEAIKNYRDTGKGDYMFVDPGNNNWAVWGPSDLFPIANTDWLEEQFGNSFSQEHSLSVSGGGEKNTFYFSANYLDQNGVLKHAKEDKQRYTVTGKLSTEVWDWLRMSYTSRWSRMDYGAPIYMASGTDEFYHNMMRYWPIVPVVDPNGNYVPESYVDRLQHGGRSSSQNDVLSQQLALQMTPAEGLLINVELNYRTNNNAESYYEQKVYAYDADNNPYEYVSNSYVREYRYRSNYFNPNIFGEYTRDFGDHNIKVMAGFQSEWLRQNNLNVRRNDIMSGIPTIDTTSGKTQNVWGGPASWSTAGFFGRLNYNYANRYMFEANLRYDGSSRFVQEKRWNLFPSFSAGWNIAQEDFWKDYTRYLSTFKLRASWGRLGNQNTDNWFPYYPTMGFEANGGNWLVNGSKPNIAWQPGLISSLLTWEKTETWEVGLDWAAFNNRLTGSFGYYQRKTYDMVGPAPELPGILGTEVPRVNNLDMTSKGFDFQISWRDQIKDFTYGALFTLSDNVVTIDRYPNPSKNLGQYFVGRRLGDIWGYTTVGIAKTDEEMQAHLAEANQDALASGWKAGDIMYADLNGDGKVNSGSYTLDDHGDLSLIGNSTPRFNFGLDLTAAYKGFDLKVFFQGTMKRDFWPSGAPFWGTIGQGQWQAVGLELHKDYFRPNADHPLGQNLDSYYPASDWGAGRNTLTQSRFIQDASYARLKNLTLGYTLPQNLTEQIYVQNLRFFISGENLLTLTKFTKVSDPELLSGGYGNEIGKAYPLSRTFSVGLNITF